MSIFSGILGNIIEEDAQQIEEQMENSQAWKDLQQMHGLLDKCIETGDINLFCDFLGKERIGASTNSKSVRQKKQILQSTDSRENILAQVTIKTEKMSILEPAEALNEPVTVKLEKPDISDMAAPKLPLRKRRVAQQPSVDLPKRSTRTRRKAETDTNSELTDGETPDVILQDVPVPVIDLNASDASVKGVRQSTRTRTKTRKNKEATSTVIEKPIQPTSKPLKMESKHKRDRSIEEDNVQVQLKKSKSNTNSSIEANKTGQTEYEDAMSTVEINEVKNEIPETRQAPDANSTFVVTKTNSDNKKNVDESEAHSVTVQKQAPKVAKTVVSPSHKSAVEKKGEPLDKVQKTTKIPTKAGSSEVVGSKAQTPLSTKFNPLTASTSKVSKMYPAKKVCTPTGGALSSSALKTTQAEYREREKRRLEKEQDALKKKEALLQATAEEKKKKREEKQMKVQLQREQIEKEKQKLLEIQEKKRQLTQKDTDPVKEQKKKQKIAEMQSKGVPLYMVTKAPFLPTGDCYDSDDEYSKSKYMPPAWASERRLVQTQKSMTLIGEVIKNTFFCRKIHSPDLQEIFEYIDPKKLKRTSSAVWRKPARYTMFQTTTLIAEDDEDNKDD